MSAEIHQELTYDANPERVYALLTDATQFSEMTGAPAEIDAADGGAFRCFGGMIVGRNIECAPGKRLVQAWRVKSWEPGVYSLVRFALHDQEGKTQVVLDHIGYPDGQAEHLGKGWYQNYWDPMRKVLTR